MRRQAPASRDCGSEALLTSSRHAAAILGTDPPCVARRVPGAIREVLITEE
jgi:hypothetical protein